MRPGTGRRSWCRRSTLLLRLGLYDADSRDATHANSSEVRQEDYCVTYCVHASCLGEFRPKGGFHFWDRVYPQTIEPDALQRGGPLQQRRPNEWVILIEILKSAVREVDV